MPAARPSASRAERGGILRPAYVTLVASGEIEADPAQARVVARFEALLGRLAEAATRPQGQRARPPVRSRQGRRRRSEGLYVCGEVGRGKTMLMDLFYDAAPTALGEAPRAFQRLHERCPRAHLPPSQRGQGGTAKGDDPIRAGRRRSRREARLLCFDEFSVTDIADAMILGRLFTHLFELGVVVVATSNVAPDRLYEGGLNRALFLPFVELLKEHMEVVRSKRGPTTGSRSCRRATIYLVRPRPERDAALDAAFLRLTGAAPGQAERCSPSRAVPLVPQAAMGVARFSFADLCETPSDRPIFSRSAAAFHTLVLDDVPVIEAARRDVAKRFITLIDTLYDRGVKLVVSAAAEPAALYPLRTAARRSSSSVPLPA